MATIQQDIREEIEFHIAAQSEELVDKGWTPEDASREAEKRFGDRHKIFDQCHIIQTGPLLWVTRASLIGVALSLLVIGGLTYSIFQLQQKNAVLAARLSSAANLAIIEPNVATNHEPLSAASSPAASSPDASFPPPTYADSNSLKGKVIAADGKPIAKAKVALAHKSWPNQKFTFENNLTETDKDGKFEFEDMYSTDGNNEFLVTVFADGHEMKSEYVSIKAKKKAGSIDFKLKPTKAIRLKVLGEDKKPMADTDVVLISRKAGTKEHMIYPISAEDIKISTDKDGFVTVSHLTEGDDATFGVLIFNEIVQAELKVTKEDEQIITVQKKR